ncbi:hypothetical protein [Bradyrhizobium sp. USDA 3256]
MKVWLGIGALLLALIVGAQFITIFVVQPVGALPEGRTVVIARLTKLNWGCNPVSH